MENITTTNNTTSTSIDNVFKVPKKQWTKNKRSAYDVYRTKKYKMMLWNCKNWIKKNKYNKYNEGYRERKLRQWYDILEEYPKRAI